MIMLPSSARRISQIRPSPKKKIKIDMKNKTIEQLKKEYKVLKSGTNFFAGILIVLFIVTIYNSFSQKSFDPLLAMAFAFSAILPMNYKKMKTIKTEIDSRK